MIAPRGPSGVAAFPPPGLAASALPLQTVAAQTPLYRIHHIAFGAIFFGPGAGAPPTYRFDSASGAFGVLYAGLTFEGALVETLLRNPRRNMVAQSALDTRALSVLRPAADLKLVALHGAGLQSLNLDNSISTGPYAPCGAWADALFAHPEQPDGLAYCSRHDPRQICLALFERPARVYRAEAPVKLTERLAMVARTLAAYGKSLTP